MNEMRFTETEVIYYKDENNKVNTKFITQLGLLDILEDMMWNDFCFYYEGLGCTPDEIECLWDGIDY